jgi:uncharacterized protein
MEIEFDPGKSAGNEKARALPFELVRELEWAKARITRDDRRDYGEERFVAFVPKDGRLYVVCFCLRAGTTRVIGFREANEKEVKSYGKISQASLAAPPTPSSDAASAETSDRRRRRGPRTD